MELKFDSTKNRFAHAVRIVWLTKKRIGTQHIVLVNLISASRFSHCQHIGRERFFISSNHFTQWITKMHICILELTSNGGCWPAKSITFALPYYCLIQTVFFNTHQSRIFSLPRFWRPSYYWHNFNCILTWLWENVCRNSCLFISWKSCANI